jgi:hypothetical protein
MARVPLVMLAVSIPNSYASQAPHGPQDPIGGMISVARGTELCRFVRDTTASRRHARALRSLLIFVQDCHYGHKLGTHVNVGHDWMLAACCFQGICIGRNACKSQPACLK